MYGINNSSLPVPGMQHTHLTPPESPGHEQHCPGLATIVHLLMSRLLCITIKSAGMIDLSVRLSMKIGTVLQGTEELRLFSWHKKMFRWWYIYIDRYYMYQWHFMDDGLFPFTCTKKYLLLVWSLNKPWYWCKILLYKKYKFKIFSMLRLQKILRFLVGFIWFQKKKTKIVLQ